LQLLYLLKHLNPLERIRLQLKNKLAAMKMLLDTVESFFREMTLEQALAWAAA